MKKNDSPSKAYENETEEEKLEAFEKLGKVTKDDDGKIISNENDEKVEVTWKTYWKMIQYYGGIKFFILYNISGMIFKYFETKTEYTIGLWSSDESVQHDKFKQFLFLILYYGVMQATTQVIKQQQVFFAGMRASNKIHNEMVSNVIKAPINLYYDVTPVGRVLNKFTKDLGSIDDQVHHHLNWINSMAMDIVQIFTIIFLTNWKILLVVPFIFMAQVYYLKRTMPAWKEMCRLHSTVRTPMINIMNETTSGASTIKAFDRQHTFTTQFMTKINQLVLQAQSHSGVWQWFSVRLNLLSMVLLCASMAIIMANRLHENPIMVAMCLNYTQRLRHILGGLLHGVGHLEEMMSKVQRIFNLSEIAQEKKDEDCEIQADQLPQEWPQNAEISFEDVELRYRPKTEKVLKGLSFKIQKGHKVGVVGRTGAGKSTLSLALTRIIEIESGNIQIDGVDISQIPLKSLRDKITIIPQDPTLFQGSLRFNLDPSETIPEQQIIDLLKEAGLQNLLNRQVAEKKNKDDKKESEKEDEKEPSPLDYKIEEGGANLSSGEKQLLCICRAILRQNKIVILDEATSNIDIVTEQKIQALIQKAFADCTMITIAHRLQTIVKSDRVLVLGQGKVMEYAEPDVLLQNPESHFTKLVNELKKEEESD